VKCVLNPNKIDDWMSVARRKILRHHFSGGIAIRYQHSSFMTWAWTSCLVLFRGREEIRLEILIMLGFRANDASSHASCSCCNVYFSATAVRLPAINLLVYSGMPC
jgi:hypothetical protein